VSELIVSTNLLGLIRDLKIPHHVSEDCWHTCPAVNLNPNAEGDWCCRESAGTNCECGADKHNAKVDKLIELIESGVSSFLLALGTTYREELARKIDQQVDDVIRHDILSIVQEVALRVLSEDSPPATPELCGHIGYPFGEPPARFCDLPAGHSGGHESSGYKHASVEYNRRIAGLK